MDGYDVRIKYNTCAANCSPLKCVMGNWLLKDGICYSSRSIL